ncbi:ATP-binding cassette domain-containing protein [Sebaldella sp. S0638]|uniref:ABC transporter ATP-binding protein n=1 Tax=Sebaldella sp. S0638 TaxID=2957809 RepID=UPI0020A09034|nr:ABC transporter ATP-binding protein [Sebaldella sp. S0638]
MIELINIEKRFGNKRVLRNISLTLREGKVYGLFGPNGVGKTTLLKIMAGYNKKTSGEYLINGVEFTYENKDHITFISDKEIFYGWMKIKDAVKYYKDFFTDFDEEKCLRLIKMMKLEENEKINVLSKGMKARLKVALAISRNAKLYLLDEPLGGLDPVSRKIILDTIKTLMNKDGILIITSHLVNDVADIIDHILFISEGEIILDTEKSSLDLENHKLEDYYVKEYLNV